MLNLKSRNDRRDAMSLTAAYTGLSIDYVEGVSSLDDNSLPPGGNEKGLAPGTLFAWRGHMNALRL